MAPEAFNLPVLPNGWHYEDSPGSTEIVHVVWPDHGAVSIHLRHRTIESGWCTPRRADPGVELPKGRNWKTQLVEAAVMKLQAAWA